MLLKKIDEWITNYPQRATYVALSALIGFGFTISPNGGHISNGLISFGLLMIVALIVWGIKDGP